MQMNLLHYASLLLKETPGGQRFIGSEANTRRRIRFAAAAARRGIRGGRVLKVQHRNLGDLHAAKAEAGVGRRSSSDEAANHRGAKDACIRSVCEHAHE